MKVYLLMFQSYDFDQHRDVCSVHATRESAMKRGTTSGEAVYASVAELDAAENTRRGRVEAYYVQEEEVLP